MMLLCQAVIVLTLGAGAPLQGHAAAPESPAPPGESTLTIAAAGATDNSVEPATSQPPPRRERPARHRHGHPVRWAFALAGIALFVAFWVAVYVVGRRSGGARTVIRTESDFQRQVIEADQPVLLEFSKTWCPTCVFLAPVMDRLARRYAGKVLVAKFPLMTQYFWINSRKLMKRYRVWLFPTVILFVKGQERRRWSLRYRGGSYRRAIEAELALGDKVRGCDRTGN